LGFLGPRWDFPEHFFSFAGAVPETGFPFGQICGSKHMSAAGPAGWVGDA